MFYWLNWLLRVYFWWLIIVYLLLVLIDYCYCLLFVLTFWLLWFWIWLLACLCVYVDYNWQWFALLAILTSVWYLIRMCMVMIWFWFVYLFWFTWLRMIFLWVLIVIGCVSFGSEVVCFVWGFWCLVMKMRWFRFLFVLASLILLDLLFVCRFVWLFAALFDSFDCLLHISFAGTLTLWCFNFDVLLGGCCVHFDLLWMVICCFRFDLGFDTLWLCGLLAIRFVVENFRFLVVFVGFAYRLILSDFGLVILGFD